MLEVILYAIPMGIALGFAAGPIFFVVIETSITQGKAKAFLLDIGAVVADIAFISIAFFGSQSLLDTLRDNLWVALLSGLAIVAFGLFYILKSRQSSQFQKTYTLKRKRYFFLKGFLLNFFNIGVLFYWVATTVAFGSIVNHDQNKMLVFYGVVLGSYLLIDLFKIYFANKFKERLKGHTIQFVEKIMGFVLVLFGAFIALRNILTTNAIFF